MDGRLYRTQSLSAVSSSRGRSASVDPFAGISRIRDDDFRKTIEDKVNRAKRSLSVRPDGEENSRSSYQKRQSSVTKVSAPSTVYLPSRTAVSGRIVLPSGGSIEYLPTTFNDHGRPAVRYGSVQPEMLRRRIEIDNLSLPPAIALSRKRIIDDADDAVNRGSRISSLLQQLKTGDGPLSRFQQEVDGIVPSSHAGNREEVESFAALLSKLSLPSYRGSSNNNVRHRTADVDPTAGQDFLSRLAHARGDLERVEGLASKTFNWDNRLLKWSNSTFDKLDAEPSSTHQGTKVIEVETTQSPREIFTFFNDRSVGIRQSDSSAEQAVRWAQQRRQMLENDIEVERNRERYSIHSFPTTVSVLGYVNRPPRSRVQIEDDDFVADDTEFTPHYVPTVTRQWSSKSRHFDTGNTDFITAADLDQLLRPSRPYARSVSASHVEFGRSSDAELRQPRRFEVQPEPRTKKFSTKSAPAQQDIPEMSEARRKVRAVLAKSKGDPHYFDRRVRDDNDY